MGDALAAAIGGLLWLLLLALWTAPVWIAIHRRHPQATAIAVVTLLLSWTCIGWAVGLAWALDARPDGKDASVARDRPPPHA